MIDFILASASPRRRDILKKAGYNFIIEPSNVEEVKDTSLDHGGIVKKLAQDKAKEVYSRFKKITLAADTIVTFNGMILEKPKSKEQNKEFLRLLSGNVNRVYTGYCVIKDGVEYSGFDYADVLFNDLSDELISEYVEKGLGLDKAGGYGIQDGYELVRSIVGEYDTVVGLPLKKVKEILERLL